MVLMGEQEYESGGSLLPGRNYSSSPYRFGFNGMPKDDEINGATGTSYDFGARLYDPRVGRWLSLDPLAAKYPSESPYLFAGANPIIFIDVDGKEKVIVVGAQGDSKPGNKLMFMNQAIRQLRSYSSSAEPKTILLVTSGYTAKQVARFTAQVHKYDGTVVPVSSADQVVNYTNSKSTQSPNVSQARKEDLVTKVDVFSHGTVGELSLGSEQAAFRGEDADRLASGAFEKGAVFESFACRTGLGRDSNGLMAGFDPQPQKSLAQRIANAAKVVVRAYMVRSEYGGTLNTDWDRAVGNSPPGQETIDGAQFTPDGASRGVGAGSTPHGVQQKKQDYYPR